MNAVLRHWNNSPTPRLAHRPSIGHWPCWPGFPGSLILALGQTKISGFTSTCSTGLLANGVGPNWSDSTIYLFAEEHRLLLALEPSIQVAGSP